jgi:hypothetical protein
LIYVGTRIPGSAVPLPEGWPAADHDEEDPDLVDAKLRSEEYRIANDDHEAPADPVPEDLE